MSSFKTLVIAFHFAMLAYGTYAQVPAQHQAAYNQMMKNNNLQNQLFFNRLNQPFAWYNIFRSNNEANPAHTFTVTLKDSTTLQIKSKIHIDSALNRNYLLYTDKKLSKSDSNRIRKIYCDETVAINRLDGSSNLVEGFPTDSCWLFKVIKGTVTLYSVLSEVEGMNVSNISAWKVANGSIQLFDLGELVEMLKEDKKAYKAFKKNEFYKAVSLYNTNHAQQ